MRALKNRGPPPGLTAAAQPPRRSGKAAAIRFDKETRQADVYRSRQLHRSGNPQHQGTTKRADAAKDLAGRFGVKMREIYWTQGQYDVVTLCEGEDEVAIWAFGLALSSAGNVRFQTLRAFSRDEMNGILSKLP